MPKTPTKKPVKKAAAKEQSPVGPAMVRDEHISIRKISNGYLLRESGTDRTGQYFEKETFTKTKPKVTI